MDRRKFLTAAGAGLAAPLLWRDTVAGAQTGPAPPPNVRLVNQAPQGGSGLLGGWRITEEYARGGIAIDFSRMKLWMVGHAQRNEIMEYDLPPMGVGSDVNSYPRVNPVRVIQPFWDGGYGNGVLFWRGKLWVSPRLYYATGGAQSEPLTIYAQDGEKISFPSLNRQKFSGFVKRGPGLDPLIGCGGYESGQGTQSGPSLATMSGERLIEYGWPADPGANLENWNQRAPRDPNYSVAQDTWVGWRPRTINGQLQGRWASDRIYAGGLVLPAGITYWPWMGTGPLDYAIQTYTFAPDYLNKTYTYRYDPTTYRLLGYEQRPEFGSTGVGGYVGGQELGPDGKVYLTHTYQWASGTYIANAALKVFG